MIGCLTDEKAKEVLYKVRKVINGKTAIDKKEKADAFGKLQEVRARKMAQFLHSNEPKCLGPGFECLSNPMIFHTKHI